MNSTRRISCRLIDALSENELQIDEGDFRLVDRRVVDELQKFEYYQPSLRGTIAALGLDQIGLPYERAERTRGKSEFSLRQLISLALDGILNHSVAPPVHFHVPRSGNLTCYLSGGRWLRGGELFLGKTWPPGFATIIILILGSLSLNELFLGIIGEYLGRIDRQVKRLLTSIENQRGWLRLQPNAAVAVDGGM